MSAKEEVGEETVTEEQEVEVKS
jgi:hypothetical protein